MLNHGFNLRITRKQDLDHSERTIITLQFYPDPKSLMEIESIIGLIGENIEVPLQIQEHMSLRLVLLTSLVADTQLLLRHEQTDKAYSISLGEF